MVTGERVIKLVEYLNDNHIARILTCAAPGVLLNKLATTVQAPPPFQMAAAAVLGVGILTYVGWGFIYKRVLGTVEVEEIQERVHSLESPGTAIPGTVHANLMRELVAMCDGDAAAALRLIERELIVNPAVTYLAAIELTHRRKDFDIKNPSGSSRL